MKGDRIPGQKPRAIFCYICGQGYGTQSIMIHVKACQKKWAIQQETLPPERRRKCPNPPSEFLKLTGQSKMTGEEIDELNEVGFGHYKETALEACANCNRTFNADAFTRHQRICTASNPLNPLPAKNLGEARSVKRVSYRDAEDGYGVSLAKPPSKVLSSTTNGGGSIKSGLPSGLKQPTKQITKTLENPIKKVISSKMNKMDNDFGSAEDMGYAPAPPRPNMGTVVAKKPAPRVEPSKPEPKGSISGPKPTNSKPSSSAFDEIKPKGAGMNANFDRILAMAEKQEASLNLTPCAKCGRTFASDRISKHQKVCKVNAKPKKVKIFHKKMTEKEKEKYNKGKTSKWKKQHQELVNQMKYIRQMKQVEEAGGNIRDMPPPPPSANVDYLMCPYCSRKFNPEAHEKHVKICKNVVNKPNPVPGKPAMQQKTQVNIPVKSTTTTLGNKGPANPVLSKTNPAAKPVGRYK